MHANVIVIHSKWDARVVGEFMHQYNFFYPQTKKPLCGHELDPSKRT